MVYEVHIATHRRSTQIQLLLHILIRKCNNNSNLVHKSNESKLVDLRTTESFRICLNNLLQSSIVCVSLYQVMKTANS